MNALETALEIYEKECKSGWHFEPSNQRGDIIMASLRAQMNSMLDAWPHIYGIITRLGENKEYVQLGEMIDEMVKVVEGSKLEFNSIERGDCREKGR